MKTKNIIFYRNGVKFIVEVTYTSKKVLPRKWEANIIQPLDMSPILYSKSGWLIGMGAYVLKKDASRVDATCEYNIYDRIVDEVSYQYFYKDKIKKYKKLIDDLEEEIDKAHEEELETLYKKKRESKKLFKAKKITLFEYKKIIKEKNDLLLAIYFLKLEVYVNHKKVNFYPRPFF